MDNPGEMILDRLRSHGWCKQDFGDAEGPNCIAGAAHEVEAEDYFQHTLVWVIDEQYPGRMEAGPHSNVPNFNDHPDTTFADVERVLEKAAVKWEEERVLRND